MTNTVSLELAKELLELGLKIETEKWWIIYDKEWDCVYIESKEELADTNNYSPAYSTDELLAVLPYEIKEAIVYEQQMYYWLKIEKELNHYIVLYLDENNDGLKFTDDKSLPEALGLMCKYLLQNGFEFNGKEIVRKGEK